MKTELEYAAVASFSGDAAILICFEDQKPEALGALGVELYDTKEFAGKWLETALLHRPAGFAARRVLLVGGGKRAKFSNADLRRVAGTALRQLKAKSLKTLALELTGDLAAAGFVEAAIEGAILGDFEPDTLKSEKNGDKSIEAVTLSIPGGAALEAALDRGRILAESQNFTRSLINEPGNRLSPAILAERAQAMAAEQGLECEVLGRDRMQQLGMGALLGVAQGSAEPPVLIVLRYRAEGSATHLGLLGKGVTFDSGGLSIKPADGMEKMKYDMAGGATVLGAMRALAQLKPAIAVTALIPAVENMTGSRAQRPGDIVKTLSGKTVEVLNTDAEGRLILADTLTYARQQGCTHLVDVATLTGAIGVALGHIYSGVLSNDDPLREKVMAAGAAEGEKMWQLPLDEEYKDYLKSAFADLPNIGGRFGGAITAAWFLREFAHPTPWVHLDIAGTAWIDDAKPFAAKGASGVALRSLVRLATSW